MEKKRPPFNTKNVIAVGILLIVAFVTGFITIRALSCADTMAGLDYISKTVLPLAGTWMGALIAYYFAKDNFDATNKQINKVIDTLTPEKALAGKKVKDEMIPVSAIESLEYNEKLLGESILDGILKDERFKNRNRFPVFENKVCRYVIHKSTFYEFIALMLEKMGLEEIRKLTFGDLIKTEEERIKRYLKGSVEFVSSDATMLDAKRLMDSNNNCEDVMVTDSGNKNEEVLGWITDVEIAKNAKV